MASNRIKKLFALVTIIAITATPSHAKSLRKTIVLGAGVIAGAAAIQAVKKKCTPVRDIDTGRIKLQCNRTIEDQDSALTLKSSNTYQLRKALNEERISSGLPPDPDDCDAHHIVPKSENRPWAKDLATSARSSLSGCVDIDSAENGVYLPGKESGSNCKGTYHKTLHTRAYYAEIEDRLRNAKQFNGCDGVQSELNAIKSELIEGAKW